MTRGKWSVFCWLLCERCETFASHYAAAASPAKMNLLAGRQLERWGHSRQLERWGLSPWILNRFIKVSTYKLVRRSFATYIFKLSSYFGFRRYGRGGGGASGASAATVVDSTWLPLPVGSSQSTQFIFCLKPGCSVFYPHFCCCWHIQFSFQTDVFSLVHIFFRTSWMGGWGGVVVVELPFPGGIRLRWRELSQVVEKRPQLS